MMISVLQGMFLIRPAKDAFKDFMDTSVLFIFASIDMVFTKNGYGDPSLKSRALAAYSFRPIRAAKLTQ
jgi:hypothetical protein